MGGFFVIPYYNVTFSSRGPLSYFPPLYSSCNSNLLNLDHTTNVGLPTPLKEICPSHVR